MIKEWLEYITASAPDWAKERGLVYESIALKARWVRQRQAWLPHTNNCQKTIREFVSSYNHAVHIMVFGSGHLIDFPREMLSDARRKFYLIDAVHPKTVVDLAKKFPSVQLLNWDLSQRPEVLWKENSDLMPQIDLVISCNVLSQIPLSLNLDDKGESPTLAASRHLAFFSSLGKPGILISDYLRRTYDREGRLIETEKTIPSLSQPKRSWTWALAPLGEISKNRSVTLEVGVWTSQEIKNDRFKR